MDGTGEIGTTIGTIGILGVTSGDIQDITILGTQVIIIAIGIVHGMEITIIILTTITILVITILSPYRILLSLYMVPKPEDTIMK